MVGAIKSTVGAVPVTEPAMLTHELLLATAIVVLVVLIHIVGLGVLVKGLRSHSILFRSLRIMPLTLLLFATLGIIALHTLEIWFYAAIR